MLRRHRHVVRSNYRWFAWSMLIVGLMVIADEISRWY
jgi:hypothetical protein